MNPLFYHGKTTDDHRFTIAGVEDKDNSILMGAAVCSPKDHFVKSEGRKKASGRILSHDIKGKSKYYLAPQQSYGVKSFVETCKKLSEMSSKRLREDFNL